MFRLVLCKLEAGSVKVVVDINSRALIGEVADYALAATEHDAVSAPDVSARKRAFREHQRLSAELASLTA